MTVPPWGGRRAQQAKAALKARTTWPTPCTRCGQTLNPNDPWICGHTHDRATHPLLTWDPNNHQVECANCSDASGQASVQRAAAHRTITNLGLNPADHTETIENSIRTTTRPSNKHSVFPEAPPPKEPPPLPVSLSKGQSAGSDGPSAAQDGQNGGKDGLAAPTTAQDRGQDSAALRSDSVASDSWSVPERLKWDPERLSSYPWLLPFLDVPGNANPPLAMSLPHPEAVGSYGAQAIAWIEQAEGKRLRWWQKLAVVRQLEHRADGSLTAVVVVESASRRSGKSVRMKGSALWRLTFGPKLFGERQEIVHTGSDLAVCRKVQKGAWRWAALQGLTVTRGNGKEAIESAAGDTWLVRAQAATYGWDTTYGLVDEGWNVAPDTVSEGLEPSLLERASPQLHLTSTAHRRATSMMRRKLADALAIDDGGKTLLLLWAAPPGADSGDPETWRLASPHWTPERAEMIRARYEAALRGEADPEADDLDPMAGFEAQYLNRWSLRPVKIVPGLPVVSPDDWSALAVGLPAGRPDAVTVEGWPGGGLSVVRAWRDGARVVVDAADVPDLASAVALVETWDLRTVAVGADMVDDPVWRQAGLRVSSRSGSVLAAVTAAARLLSDGVLRHTGGDHLTGQVLALRTSPGVNGMRLRSTGRADAVKAAVWAVQVARQRPAGKSRIIVV